MSYLTDQDVAGAVRAGQGSTATPAAPSMPAAPAPAPAPPATLTDADVAAAGGGAPAPSDADVSQAMKSGQALIDAPSSPADISARVNDPNTTYTVRHRSNVFWGLGNTDTPMTFPQMFDQFVPGDAKTMVYIHQNAALRAAANGDPDAPALQAKADQMMHDFTHQYVSAFDPTAFPEDESRLRSQYTQALANGGVTGQVVTAADQAIGGVGNNFSQAFGLQNVANELQGKDVNTQNADAIRDELRSQVEHQVNPETASIAHVAGHIVAPESIATGAIAGEAGAGLAGATGSPTLGRVAAQGLQGASFATTLAGSENRLPGAGELATNVAGSVLGGAAAGAASEALPFAQRGAEAAVKGDLPAAIGNKAADLASTAVTNAAAMVATNFAAAKAQGQPYTPEQAGKDFAAALALEPAGRAGGAITHGGDGPVATFPDEASARKFAADNPNTTYQQGQTTEGAGVHAVVPVPEGTRTPETQQRSSDMIAAAENHVRLLTRDPNATLTPLEPADVAGGEVGDELARSAGLTLHWFTSNRPLEAGEPTAVSLGGGHIAVDARTADRLSQIPHEFIHELRRSDPAGGESYQDLLQLAQTTAPNRLAQSQQEYSDLYRQTYGRDISPDRAQEEGLARFFQRMTADDAHLNYLRQRDPTLLDRFGAYVRDALGVAPAPADNAERMAETAGRLGDLTGGVTDVAARPTSAGVSKNGPAIPPSPRTVAEGRVIGLSDSDASMYAAGELNPDLNRDQRKALAAFRETSPEYKAYRDYRAATPEGQATAKRKASIAAEQEIQSRADELIPIKFDEVHKELSDGGGVQKKESESGSRYYNMPDGSVVRVSDHAPNEATDQWMERNGVEERRVDHAAMKQARNEKSRATGGNAADSVEPAASQEDSAAPKVSSIGRPSQEKSPSTKPWTVDRIKSALTKQYEDQTGDTGSAEDIVLHPDQLDGIPAGRTRSKLEKFADEDEWTNRTADMSAKEASAFSDRMLDRATRLKASASPDAAFKREYTLQRKQGLNDQAARTIADQLLAERAAKQGTSSADPAHFEDALQWAHGHEDPAVQFMAWMHDNRAGTKKDLIDLSSPEKVEEMLGKTFTINKEPFRIQVDDQGGVHLVDSDVAFADPERIGDGHVPVDAGSIRDELKTPPSEDVPFSLARGQLTLAGEREGRATVGDTGPLLPDEDAQRKSIDVRDNGTNEQTATKTAITPADAKRFGLTDQDLRSAEAHLGDDITAAGAYGVKRAKAGLGMKAVEGMTSAEAKEAHAAWKATRAGLSPIGREAADNPASLSPTDQAERQRIAKNQTGDTGSLFSLMPRDENDKRPFLERAAVATKAMIRDVRDNMNLDPVPRLSRAGAGDSAAAHAFARPAAKYIADDVMAKVFPTQYHDAAATSQTWDALNADRILGIHDEFRKRAAAKTAEAADLQQQPTTVKGANDNEIKNLLQGAKEYTEKANAIDVKHGVANLEAKWQSAMKDPEIAGNVERWNNLGAPVLDGLYNEMKALDPDAPQPPRGRHSAGVSLVSNDHDLFDYGMGEQGATEPDPKQPAGGTMRNAKVSKDRWDQSASGLGDYETNPETVLNKIIGARWNQVTKLRLFKDMENSGTGYIADAPPVLNENGKPVQLRRLDITQPKTEDNGYTRMVPKTMWVRPEAYRETRDVLNTDLAPPSSPVFRALTRIQLLQVADAVTHTKNLHSVLASALGGESGWRDLARKVPGIATGDAVQEWVRTWREMVGDGPGIREEMAAMAKAGNLRPDFPAAGIQKITKMQDFLHAADTAGRVILNRRFDNLVARGEAVDSGTNRRNFIAQLGNYNRRLMNPMARIFKDLGLSPFVTAGTTFNRQGRRLLTGDPGYTATSTGAALKARAINLGGVVMAMGLLPSLVNMATTGHPLGRSGTPFGAIDTGTDDDQGNHRIFDYLQLMGMRRGLRSLGIDAIANGLIDGKDWNTIGGNAVNDVTQAALHPWMGPGVGFAAAALTGRRLDTRGKMEANVMPQGGLAQNLENARAALQSQNPFVYGVGKAIASPVNKALGGGGDGQGTGADLADVAGTLLKSPLGAAGIKSVQPGTDAAQDAASRLAGAHFGDAGPTAAVSAKSAAIRKLVDSLRSGDEDAMDQVHAAVEAGTIGEKDVAGLINRSSMSDMQWKVSHLSGADAARVYNAGTESEQNDMRDAVINRIARDNTLSSADRADLLRQVGASGAEASMLSELSDLQSAENAKKGTQQRVSALGRQISAAAAAGNGAQVQKLRQQRQSLVRAGAGMKVNGGRLKTLRATRQRAAKIRSQALSGSIPRATAEKRVRQLLGA